VQKDEKQRVVTELTDRIQSTETLIVADYRGLTMPQIDDLRTELLKHGARFTVVKNTLTRRAAEAAGAEALLALLEGPTAIAFVQTDGDPVAVAKALADTAKDTKVLTLRGGILSGRSLTGDDVEELAKLPAPEVVKSQLVGVVVAPLTQLVALLAAPVRDLVGLIDARIEQLGGASAEGETPAEVETTAEVETPAEPEAETPAEPVAEAADAPEAETEEPAEPAATESAETAETEEE